MLTVTSFAVTATQTDWSGSSGIPGPVTNWGSNYFTSTLVSTSITGVLQLVSRILPVSIEHTVGGNFNGAASVYAIDIDGDGDTDIVGAAIVANDINWWENTDGSGTVWMNHSIDTDFDGACSVYATDVDGDGDTDILGTAKDADEITWWENTNGSGTFWTEHILDGDFDFANSVYATDVDGDGDIDILGTAGFADEITWWENIDGYGTLWTEHIIDSGFDGASSVYATDIDGDGDTDVLGAAKDADEITWWENINGSGTAWMNHSIDNDFDGASSVYATDIDGDGDTDVLGAALIDAEFTWWENTDGYGTAWTEHTIYENFLGASSVYATDIDGDGDIDVMGAAISKQLVAWWENTDGSGSAWKVHYLYRNFDGARSIYATDIDDDGIMDILVASRQDDDITWWDVMGYYTTGDIESSILDAGAVECWDTFGSSADEPNGTSLGFQFRSSQDSSNMGAWSDTIFTSGTSFSGILADSTDFLQYRVILQTTDPTNTPVLNDVSFLYTAYLGITDNNALSWSLAPARNPSFSIFAVQVSVPQLGTVDLVLHDITGRVVTSYSQELPGGIHSISFDNLSEGVYFCTMHAGDFTATERVVVLK